MLLMRSVKGKKICHPHSNRLVIEGNQLSASIPSNINGNDHPTSTDNVVRNLNTPGTIYSYHANAIDNRPATALFLPPVNIFRRNSVASNVNNRPTSSMHWSNR